MTRQQKVLIVEDEMIIALMVEKMVERLGHAVVGKVTSGEHAIKAAKEHKPDLILMDIRLQGEMDGIEAMKSIRESDNIPVIYITGNSDEGYKKRAQESEYLAFLTKPVTYRELTQSFLRAS